jgi:hypothetical protein
VLLKDNGGLSSSIPTGNSNETTTAAPAYAPAPVYHTTNLNEYNIFKQILNMRDVSIQVRQKIK